jgi:hypothetical protein
MQSKAIVVQKPAELQTGKKTLLTLYVDTSILESTETEAADELKEVTSTDVDAVTVEVFAERAREVARDWDRIEGMRLAAVEPLNAEKTRVQALFKPALQALDTLKRALAGKVGAYQLKQDEERRALEAEAAKAARKRDQKALTEAITKAESAGPVKLAGSGTRFAWRVANVDPAKLPEEYFKRVVDEDKVQALVKGLKGDAQPKKVPGVTFERVAVTSVKR